MDSVILKHILSCQGSVDQVELECNIGDAAEIIRQDHDKFVSCLFNGKSRRVVVRSRIRLCRPKEGPGHGRLHLCKNFLLSESGNCRFLLSRTGCSFPHDLHSEDNMEVLKEFGLETLSRTELCLLLLQSENALLPPICHDYNNRGGCRGECLRLHVCERFLSRDCNCFRTHNFSAPQLLKLLQNKHIPDHLFKVLKSIYANKQALRLADKGNRSLKFESQPVHGPVDEDKAVVDNQEAQLLPEDTPKDWAACDSDSSCSTSTNPNENGCDPGKKERRSRGRRKRGKMRESNSANCRSNRYGQSRNSKDPRTCEEMCNRPLSPGSLASVVESVDVRALSIGKQSQRKKDKAEICMFFIRGHCRNEGHCLNAHDKMPYRWEIKQNGHWTPMADNEAIENDYCLPQNTHR